MNRKIISVDGTYSFPECGNDKEVVPYGIFFKNPCDGVFYICPPHWVAEDLGISLDEMWAYMYAQGMSLTHIKNAGYAISNIEMSKLHAAFSSKEHQK